MIMQFGWALAVIFGLTSLVGDANAATTSTAEVGVVTSVSEGTLYIGGIAHSIATVNTGHGAKRVAVPTMGGMQPLQVGESLTFSGPSISINSDLVINTREGYIFRASEKSMAAFMADMTGKAQAQAEEEAKNGIMNAVPTVLMETPAQLQEKAQAGAAGAAKRRTDLLLTLLSLVVALLALVVTLLAFERMQHLAVAPIRWIKSRFAKQSVFKAKESAQQSLPPDPPAAGR